MSRVTRVVLPERQSVFAYTAFTFYGMLFQAFRLTLCFVTFRLTPEVPPRPQLPK
uniref:Uncharacterized protein n=1 Tax=Chloracidobacterium thermophilum TaxID=458033 RepID=A8DJX9_9BACT|nr:hypothetical protein YS_M60-F11.222 [Chloracidobacterium thermophilum]